MDESEQILSMLRQIIRAIDVQSRNLAKKYGLTGPQLLVLREIHKDDSITSGRIAANISLSHATVTSIIDRLEKRKYVSRIKNNEDKRKVSIKLEDKANEMLKNQPSLLQEDFIRRFQTLEVWERTLLISSLQRIASMMNAEKIQSPPVLVSGRLDATEKDVAAFLDDGAT